MSSPARPPRPSATRAVLALAVPAFGALAAEPLFVMVDTAIVGHLGTAPLAGLALAGTVLDTCVYLGWFGAETPVHAAAWEYLRWSAPGLPAMLVVLAGVGAAAKTGAPLFLRTCCLRAAGLATLAVAASLGAVQLAAHQIAANVWMFSALTTDALAIAAQALVGARLGAADRAGLTEVKRVVIRLSVLTGPALLWAGYAGWFMLVRALVYRRRALSI
ncbi:MAG: hypothetical protein LBS27_05685 [Bifidobacteriaceae bacterium]|jgi:Na+-driven multidrug efflux pump|nr:hypothetical protein [Bifidobacteriaceae bacterium]